MNLLKKSQMFNFLWSVTFWGLMIMFGFPIIGSFLIWIFPDYQNLFLLLFILIPWGILMLGWVLSFFDEIIPKGPLFKRITWSTLFIIGVIALLYFVANLGNSSSRCNEYDDQCLEYYEDLRQQPW